MPFSTMPHDWMSDPYHRAELWQYVQRLQARIDAERAAALAAEAEAQRRQQARQAQQDTRCAACGSAHVMRYLVQTDDEEDEEDESAAARKWYCRSCWLLVLVKSLVESRYYGDWHHLEHHATNIMPGDFQTEASIIAYDTWIHWTPPPSDEQEQGRQRR